MMPIAKHFDPVMGIDIHIVTIPPAGPVPIPHPHISLVTDLFDYIPILGGTVKVGGVYRATAGTSGRAIPHIPMGGPFIKPPGNEDEVFMGSATVTADSAPLSFTALPVLSCQEVGMISPFRAKKPKKTFGMVLPTSLVISIPIGMPVVVGGPPTINLMALAGRLGFAALGKAFKKLRAAKKAGNKSKKITPSVQRRAKQPASSLSAPSNPRHSVPTKKCTSTGHPVDVATGKLFTETVDFELPGPLPLVWERSWFSTSVYSGPLGHGWHHSYDYELMEGNGAVAVRLPDGRPLAFPLLKEGETCFDRAERVTLLRDSNGYALDQIDGVRYRFLLMDASNNRHKLKTITQMSTGAQIQLEYDADERLRRIIDSGGRCIHMEYQGPLLHQVWLPDPDVTNKESWYRAIQYYYQDGLLVAVDDALDQRMSYVYQGRLLVQETYRDGLSFYFRFDRPDEHARCIETWGDGGIYYRALEYDLDRQITRVVDGLGHRMEYHHNGVVPHKIVDPLGNISTTTYNEHTEILSETDELGYSTLYAYDEFGNKVQSTDAAGEITAFSYDDRHNLVAVEDVIGGRWAYEYDFENRLVRETNPLGQSVSYQYERGLLVGIVDQGGQHYRLGYDSDKNLCSLSDDRGRTMRWHYDGQGNLLASTDPRGNTRRLHHDRLGRVVRIDEPDGNVRQFSYDAGDNPVQIKDQNTDVQLKYQGMGRLVSRSQGGASVRFEYDREEQLIGIFNEQGRAYQFELDPCGEVLQESGFDGLIRRYRRDERGQVSHILRPEERWSEYQYDPLGRVTQVVHHNGEREQFQYRPDGALIKARNQTSTVLLERDVLGRLIKESQDDHWVTSTYDAMGNRIRVQSSMGLDQTIERDQDGAVMAVSLGDAANSTQFTRDLLGLEMQRTMPGGLQSRWQRDKLGRPTRHEIVSPQRNHHGRTYVWGTDDRLLKVLDHLNRETLFKHDTLGNLVAARYSDDTLELRLPDAVGNLFRTEAQKDREYGPAGQLLAVHGKQGTTHYQYDAEGNLVRKITADNRVWQYQWNSAGHMSQVIRPDGRTVTFAYDALGRRVSKSFAGKTTHWMWDGNNPVHEWVVYSKFGVPAPQQAANDAGADEIAADQRVAQLQPLQAQAPPHAQGSTETPVTWVFEPDSFAPMGKQIGDDYYPIVTDYLGTPVAMFNAEGAKVWSADISVWGDLRNQQGHRQDCPFRWPGQYEDEETGLYYNRFRYYDPEAGQYVSQDPIGLAGGNPTLYGYVRDCLNEIDVLGLNSQPSLPSRTLFESGNTKIVHYYHDLAKEHADPIHFHIEENGRSIGKIKADGTLLDGKTNKAADRILSSKSSINKLRRAEKKIANFIRKVGGGMVGGRPFKPGSRGCKNT